MGKLKYWTYQWCYFITHALSESGSVYCINNSGPAKYNFLCCHDIFTKVHHYNVIYV